MAHTTLHPRWLTRGQPTALISWSRHCGAAIVLFVVDEAPSEDLKRYLATLEWTLPVYHDSRSSAMKAFNTFGTPAYYVIDRAGRIRFDEVGEEAELIAQVDAVRSETSQPAERNR